MGSEVAVGGGCGSGGHEGPGAGPSWATGAGRCVAFQGRKDTSSSPFFGCFKRIHSSSQTHTS